MNFREEVPGVSKRAKNGSSSSSYSFSSSDPCGWRAVDDLDDEVEDEDDPPAEVPPRSTSAPVRLPSVRTLTLNRIGTT